MHTTNGRAIKVPPPSAGEMAAEIMGLTTGLTILLLPLFVTALPGVLLLLVAPAILLAAAAAVPAVIAAAVIGPPYLLLRAARRRREKGPAA